jgi:HK97 family phage major capsid protein
MATPADSILELRQERARNVTRMREILDAAEAREDQRGVLTGEETQEYERLETGLDELGTRIARHEAQRDRELEQEQRARPDFDPSQAQGNDTPTPVEEQEQYRDVFWQYIQRGMAELGGEQRKILRSGYRADETRADQLKTTGAAGGFLVPVNFWRTLQEHLVQAGAIRQTRATQIVTAGGEDLQVPKTTTHGAAQLLAEGSAATGADDVFAQVTLNAYTYVRLIRASLQLVEDDAVGIESYLARELGRSIGALQNTHFVVGTGSSQPQGMFTASGGFAVGKQGTTGQTLTIIYDDLIDLIHSVAVPYRRNGQFVASDLLIKALRKLKDLDSRPIWEPSLQVGMPDSLLGYPVFNDPDVPVPAASARTMLFGDLEPGYWIRDVRGVTVRRLDERFADALLIGFLGWMRADGDLIDTNAARLYQHSAT